MFTTGLYRCRWQYRSTIDRRALHPTTSTTLPLPPPSFLNPPFAVYNTVKKRGKMVGGIGWKRLGSRRLRVGNRTRELRWKNYYYSRQRALLVAMATKKFHHLGFRFCQASLERIMPGRVFFSPAVGRCCCCCYCYCCCCCLACCFVVWVVISKRCSVRENRKRKL